MSNPQDPKACSERADSLSVSDPLAGSDAVVSDTVISDPGADESRRPPRRKERARVKSSKRQGEAVAATFDLGTAAAAAEGVQVKLAANCTIRDCGTLKADLSAVLASPAAVSIDVSALERIDTAAIQLLCALVRDRKGRQLGVTFSGKSAALTEAVRLLGVDAVLDIRGTPASSGTASHS